MTNYELALNTSLGDYISHLASQKEITKKSLERKLTFESLKVKGMPFFGDARDYAIKEFNKIAGYYDVVIELREGIIDVGIFGIIGASYGISGTGIKLK